MSSASVPLRQVIVDDTDPSIQYNAQDWFVADPRTLDNGNFGEIYNDTSHATTSSNTQFQFPFNGTSITVQGNIDMSMDPTTNATDPTWECLVDGKTIPVKTFTSPESNWPLCSQGTLDPTEHVLTVQVQSKTRPFFLDSLVYTPISGAVFPSAVLIYGDGDPALTYSAGQWKAAGEQVTQIPGASVTLSFHGTSATLIGHTMNSFPPNASSGMYFIDGAGPTSFTLPGLASATSSTNFNRLFFTTPPLADGSHNLTVVYAGDADHTPLAVKIFYVTNTTTPSDSLGQSSSIPSGSASTALPAPSSSNTAAAAARKHSSTGAIAGGVTAGVVIILLLLLAALWIRRRRRARNREKAQTTANPFPTPQNGRPLVSTSGQTLPSSDSSDPWSASQLYGGGAVPSKMYLQPQRVPNPRRSTAPKSLPLVPQRRPVLLQHEDSGARSLGGPSSGAEYEIVELPPGYTAD
ncbi:hypothetical protein FB45DRAFT_786254 [Roridomyces roridus]|uniref:Uncharacterized protein n=1 Tax=Roridomyces roridus TaxID=1738132 RepID=A0AAD7FWX7_9AGAR|nr:hypothetical protein FB45DRAFT_786254 [Roridomyces roridus]